MSLAKYCILDLTFAVDGVDWQPLDIAGTSILKEFGFAVHPDEIPVDERDLMGAGADDPTCIRLLDDDMRRVQPLLRLFLEDVPRRDLGEYWVGMLKTGKGGLFGGGIPELERLLENYFPREMAITDACLTNAGSIWLHKHFYL